MMIVDGKENVAEDEADDALQSRQNLTVDTIVLELGLRRKLRYALHLSPQGTLHKTTGRPRIGFAQKAM
jgi:hypothetical protein